MKKSSRASPNCTVHRPTMSHYISVVQHYKTCDDWQSCLACERKRGGALLSLKVLPDSKNSYDGDTIALLVSNMLNHTVRLIQNAMLAFSPEKHHTSEEPLASPQNWIEVWVSGDTMCPRACLWNPAFFGQDAAKDNQLETVEVDLTDRLFKLRYNDLNPVITEIGLAMSSLSGQNILLSYLALTWHRCQDISRCL